MMQSYMGNQDRHFARGSAAGGGAHVAMDLLTGNSATIPSFGKLLKSDPADYTIDNAGVISVNGTHPTAAPDAASIQVTPRTRTYG